MEATIRIDTLRLFAHHGVSEQERRVGNHFTVSAELRYDATEACHSDEICSAVNYGEVIDTIRSEMRIPSRLLEHVAARICSAVRERFPAIKSGSVTVTKICPPCGADIAGVSVTLPI